MEKKSNCQDKGKKGRIAGQSRRKFLGSVGLGSIFGLSCFTQNARSDYGKSNPDRIPKLNSNIQPSPGPGGGNGDSTVYNDNYVDNFPADSRDLYESFLCNKNTRRLTNVSQLIYRGSFKKPTEEWEHNFELSTHSRVETNPCDYDGDETWDISSELDKVKYTFDSATSSSVIDPLPNDIGAWPTPSAGDDPIYNSYAFTVAKEVADLASSKFGFVRDAVDLIQLMKNDRPSKSGSKVIYDWQYNGSTGIADNLYLFDVQSNNQYIDFDLESRVRETGYSRLAVTQWSVDRLGTSNNSEKEIEDDSNQTAVSENRPSGIEPSSKQNISEGIKKKVPIKELPPLIRRKWEKKTDESYVYYKRFPFRVQTYNFTKAPEK